MTFQASQIGTDYDVGIAVRPNPDGSTTALNVANEDGSTVALTQVAFMFLSDEEQEEAADLVRKNQLVMLASSNVIDREFTAYPQATQGNFVGGETQRIFTDPTAYYQGRGLIWPTNSFVPVLPAVLGDIGALVDNLGAIFTQVVELYDPVASGFLTNAGVGVAHAFKATSANGTKRYIVFTLTNSASQQSGNIISAPTLAGGILSLAVINGSVFYIDGVDVNINQLTYTAGQAFNASAVFAAMPDQPTLLASGNIGKDWVLACARAIGLPVRIFLSGSGTSVDVSIPAGVTVQSMAVLGSQLFIAGSDGANGFLMSYDITAQQTSMLVQLNGVQNIKLGAVQGAIFMLAYNPAGPIASNAYLSVDMYLYTTSLQFIGHLNPFITGLPPNVAYANPASISNVTTYGQYALFAVGLSLSGAPQAIICAYDVVRGAFFTATDQFPLSVTGGLNQLMGIAVAPSADANTAPPSPVLGRVGSAGTLPAGAYQIKITWTGSGGTESLGSVAASITLSLNDAMTIRSPALAQSPVGATGINYYVTAAPGGVNLGLIGSSGLAGILTYTNPAAGNTILPPTTSTFGTAGDFTVYVVERDATYNQVGPGQVLRFNTFGYSLASAPLLSGGGRIISSVIDFTSASIKLYRQIVVTHEPIPVGTTVSVFAYLDRDGDNLTADTTYKVTNNVAGSTVTTLSINALAKKLVFIVDWPTTTSSSTTSSHPISIAIQPASGWVKTLALALSDSALVNGENPQEYCFTNQDKMLDALAARNFVRQLWRQRGGLCIVTYDDGDSYNGVIQEYRNTAKKWKTMLQPGDRKVRYEGRLFIKVAEDL